MSSILTGGLWGGRNPSGWPRRWLAVALLLTGACSPLSAQTGTFVDRWEPTDLRVVSYNVLWDTIFPQENAVQAAKFERVVEALNPDILNLQEIGWNNAYGASDVAALMDSIMPLPGGGTWYTHKGSDNVIVSKFPLSLQRTNTNPSSPRGIAIALVDLPDAQFDTDFYFMNNHFKCCGDPGGEEDEQRQQQADALVSWMRNARTSGGLVTLPANTPMAVVGDFNLVGLPDSLDNLMAGNIVDEATYGPDSAPDWDRTSLTDVHPIHNGRGSNDYTWRDDGSIYDPGRLDYVLYTDSVVDVANHFVLNTVDMTTAELSATQLQTYDVVIDPSPFPLFPLEFDHLPLVVDFRFAEPIPGDYDGSGYVDEDDFVYWHSLFGMAVAAGTEADGNGNSIVDAADYTVWRDNYGAGTPPGGGAGAAAVPEPASALMWTLCLSAVPMLTRRRPKCRPMTTTGARSKPS